MFHQIDQDLSDQHLSLTTQQMAVEPHLNRGYDIQKPLQFFDRVSNLTVALHWVTLPSNARGKHFSRRHPKLTIDRFIYEHVDGETGNIDPLRTNFIFIIMTVILNTRDQRSIAISNAVKE
jgi:hypothetical protein